MAGEFSAAPFISAGLLEGPIVDGRVSALVSGRFSVIDQELPEYLIDRSHTI